MYAFTIIIPYTLLLLYFKQYRKLYKMYNNYCCFQQFFACMHITHNELGLATTLSIIIINTNHGPGVRKKEVPLATSLAIKRQPVGS